MLRLIRLLGSRVWGAIGTALWGVVAVRRRLVMAQQLAIFESQVLSNSAVEADAVAVPNAGHQAL